MLQWACMCLLLGITATNAGQFGIVGANDFNQSCMSVDMTFIQVQNISSVVTNNSLLRICSPNLKVETAIVLNGVENVTFLGGGDERGVLNCTGNGGLKIANSFNVTLQALIILQCSVDTGQQSYAALSFINCAGIWLHHIDILESSGIGLNIFNASGLVVIDNCLFKMNSQHISIQSHNVFDLSEYEITECTFIQASPASSQQAFGGGLSVLFSSSQHMRLTVSSGNFKGNTAYKGGGMSIRIINSSEIDAKLENSSFSFNKATEGGGLHIEVQSTLATFSLTMIQCDFDSNHATLGGGLKVSSTKTFTNNSFVTFDRIKWQNNVALYGSAFCAVPQTQNAAALQGILPGLVFYDAIFQNNVAEKYYISQSQHIEEYVDGIGALYCVDFELQFFNSLHVTNNNGSGFRLEHTTMYLKEDTRAIFCNNTGGYGGAIYLLTSRIILGNRANVQFTGNIALISGGAIHYYTTSNLWGNFSDSCFIAKESTSSTGIIFTFDNNYNSKFNKNTSDSIKILSLVPCLRNLNKSEDDLKDDDMIFESIGNFSFYPKTNSHIHTSVKSFAVTNIQEEISEFVPGRPHKISIASLTDLVNGSKGIFTVRINDSNGIRVFPNAVVDGSKLTLYSNHTEEGTVLLSTKSSRRITVGFKVKVVNCPAGFAIMDNDNECTCISILIGSTKHGIEGCQDFKANRTAGMWVKHTINQTDLESGYCPSGYCTSNTSLEFVSDDSKALKICQDGRKGTLCGECRRNLTVNYHSTSYACRSNNFCYLGWLLYILMEIIPITILFLIILYKDKCLSVGPANGFVFFAQVLLVMRIDGEGFFQLPKPIEHLHGFSPLLYGMFSLDFFVHESLSFCLWHNATTLSVMAIGYLTQTYSLSLVLVVVAILNYSLRVRSVLAHFGLKVPKLDRSMVHGMVAFLILTFSQNVTISMAILRPGYIFRNKGASSTVVHYMGVYSYSSAAHIPYAIIAFASLTFFAAIPTILLILYPIHYKVLRLLCIPESFRIWKVVSLLEKIKPVFDSFQSTFKDNLRFFSGLYFLYRFLIHLAFNLNTPISYYLAAEVLLTLILVIHAVFQPHKERNHNVIDGLLIGDLLLINTLSIYHLSYTDNFFLLPLWVSGTIQILLAYIPLIIILIVCFKKLVGFLVGYMARVRNRAELENEDLNELLELESTRNDLDGSHQSSTFEPTSRYSSLSVSVDKN